MKTEILAHDESVRRMRAEDRHNFYSTRVDIEEEEKEKIYAVQEAASKLSNSLSKAKSLIQTRRHEEAVELIKATLAEARELLGSTLFKEANAAARKATGGAAKKKASTTSKRKREEEESAG